MVATLIALFTAAAGIQLLCWIFLSLGIERVRTRCSGPDDPNQGISIIVAARNAERLLPGLFGALERQSHKNFEAVIVDDRSEDSTASLVHRAGETNPAIRLVRTNGQGKKDALTAGIAEARHDLLAFTDSDCRPSNGWLGSLITAHAQSDECVVAGYGPYASRPGVLNRLIRFETLHTAVLTAATIGLGRPYMAVGRNLSYRKSTFERLGGLGQASDLLSGDDDLFVQAAAAKGIAVRYMYESESFVYSDPPLDVRAWFRQKRRHLSTARRYDRHSQAALVTYHLSAMLCWVAPFAIGWAGFLVLFARLIPAQILLSQAARDFEEKGLIRTLVPLDLLFQIYLLLAAPFGWLRPPQRW